MTGGVIIARHGAFFAGLLDASSASLLRRGEVEFGGVVGADVEVEADVDVLP